MTKKIKCKVCGYRFTTPPNFCPKCLTKVESQQEWWMPYAEPLPTWETLEEYWRALRAVRLYPFSESILDVNVKAYTAGFSEADGHFGYVTRADRPYASPLYGVAVLDRRAVEYICKAIGRRAVAVEVPPRVRYQTQLIGLPTVMFCRIVEPSLQGYGKEKAQFIIEHGFRVSKETADQFARTFPFGRTYRRRVSLSKEVVEVVIAESPPREAPPLELLGMKEEIARHYW